VTTARGVKVVRWEDELSNGDRRAARLRELADLITRIITARPAYKTLPEPEAGYR
jgi:hypothetical protein